MGHNNQFYGVLHIAQNNGIAEGCHSKMKFIQRRLYGYRNFENYRLRVLVECGGITL